MTARSRLLLIPLILLAGCSHAGSFIPPAASGEAGPMSVAAPRLTATFTILIPKSKPEDAAFPGLVHQRFIAATTQGALVRAFHHGQHTHPLASIAVNLTAKSRDCKVSAHGRTCTISLVLPVAGTDEFVVETYNQPPKAGKFSKDAAHLGIGIASAKMTKSRTIHLVIGGIVAGTSISASSGGPYPVIDSLSLPLSVAVLDADNNTIVTDTYVDRNGKPVTIKMTADSSAGSTISFKPSSFDKPPSSVTLKYSPGAMSDAQAQNGFASAIAPKASNGTPAVSITLTFSQPQLNFYPIPTGLSQPEAITSGPDGALYFTESNVNQIGRITTTGVVTNEFPLTLSSEADPRKITRGPDGNVWFTAQNGNSVDRMTTAGVVSPFTSLAAGSYPVGITVGPDNNIWFTESGTNKVGHITTAETGLIEIPLTSGTHPHGIVTGPDGAMWFTNEGSSQIGRVPVSGSPVAYYNSNPAHYPYVITTGTDGALWFGGCNEYIGRMTTAGSSSLAAYAIAGTGEDDDIAVGPDGAIWFTVATSSGPESIGRITPSGGIVYYYLPGTNPYPTGITTGPDGAIWFLELNGNMVGRLQ